MISSVSAPSSLRDFRFFSNQANDSGSDDNGNNNDASFPAIIPNNIIPSKVGYGDEAPRMPHVLALPVTNRPLFPGVVTSVTLTEPATIDALEQLQRENEGNNVYISAFLRKKNPTGVSEGGVLLPTPEVITDASDLYSVGTFAQIHRLTRGVGSGSVPPQNGVPGTGGFPDDAAAHPDGDAGGDPSASGDESSAASVLLLAHR